MNRKKERSNSVSRSQAAYTWPTWTKLRNYLGDLGAESGDEEGVEEGNNMPSSGSDESEEESEDGDEEGSGSSEFLYAIDFVTARKLCLFSLISKLLMLS